MVVTVQELVFLSEFVMDFDEGNSISNNLEGTSVQQRFFDDFVRNNADEISKALKGILNSGFVYIDTSRFPSIDTGRMKELMQYLDHYVNDEASSALCNAPDDPKRKDSSQLQNRKGWTRVLPVPNVENRTISVTNRRNYPFIKSTPLKITVAITVKGLNGRIRMKPFIISIPVTLPITKASKRYKSRIRPRLVQTDFLVDPFSSNYN